VYLSFSLSLSLSLCPCVFPGTTTTVEALLMGCPVVSERESERERASERGRASERASEREREREREILLGTERVYKDTPYYNGGLRDAFECSIDSISDLQTSGF
jgi:hypothetical protein